MALSNVALFGAAFFTPVLVGKITHTLGWQWTFYFVAIFTVAGLPLMVFFVPEPAFRRADHLNTDFEGQAGRGGSNGIDSQLPLGGVSGDENAAEPKGPSAADAQGGPFKTGPHSEIPPKDSYLKTLRLFNGRKTDENFFKLLLRPFPLFLHPGILWACLIQGVLIGWAVFIGVVIAAVFYGPPLWFNEVKTGYLYTGAFIGSLLGLVLSGLLSDSMSRIMIKLNKGVYEPEFRILLVIFQLVFSGIGLYGFGTVAPDIARYGWLIPDVFVAFVIIGMVMGAVASALYIVDAHRKLPFEDCPVGADMDRPNCRRGVYVSTHVQEHVQLYADLFRVRLGRGPRDQGGVLLHRQHSDGSLSAEHSHV